MKLVVDKMLTGWKDLQEDELLKSYEEIRKVGKYPGIPQRTDDKQLGVYCKENDCALMTNDLKAYTNFLEGPITIVQIRKYGHDEKSDQRVYILEIVS